MSKSKEIDWAEVEQLMYDSVRGRGDPDRIYRVCIPALEADPQRYKELQARVKKEARDELKRL